MEYFLVEKVKATIIFLTEKWNKWNTSLFYVRAFWKECFTYFKIDEVLLFGGPNTPNKERLNNVTIKKKQPFKENVAIKKKQRE